MRSERRRFAHPTTKSSLLVLSIAAGIAAYHWSRFGEYPPGPDWASWLAFGRWWFGQGSKGDVSAYPPLVPIFLHLCAAIVGPAMAAKVIASIAAFTTIAAVGALAMTSRLRLPFVAFAAALCGMNGMVTEVLHFAGYPQAMATATLILLLPAVHSFLNRPNGNTLLIAAALYSTIALTHHMYFVVASLSIAVLAILFFAAQGFQPAAVRSLAFPLASFGLFGLASFSITGLRLLELGYEAPLNTVSFEVESALRYAIRDAPTLWLAIIVGGASYVLLSHGEWLNRWWQFSFTLIAGPGLLFLFAPEPRLMPPILIGCILAAAVALQRLAESPLGGWYVGPSALVLPIVVFPYFSQFSLELRTYYQMANSDLFETAHWVDTNADDGLVAVRWTRAGWQLGWWFEGLTDERIAVGSDPKWIGFPAELERAELVARLFGGELNGQEVVQLARQRGVTMLVFARYEWEGWREWHNTANAVSPELVFENDRFFVFRIPR